MLIYTYIQLFNKIKICYSYYGDFMNRTNDLLSKIDTFLKYLTTICTITPSPIPTHIEKYDPFLTNKSLHVNYKGTSDFLQRSSEQKQGKHVILGYVEIF